MVQQTCFVIMPIGDQTINEEVITSAELKSRYNDLIKEAILRANPSLEVLRADEVPQPGTITTDILTRIMHSDFVVADITYPNPNVFYELGLRHACRAGTITIRDREALSTPFDIAHLRHIEYENTPTGLKALAEKLRVRFEIYSKNPLQPDNQLLELAKITNYHFPIYGPPEVDPETAQLEMFQELLASPDIMKILLRQATGEEISQEELMRVVMSDPKLASSVLKTLVKTGELSLSSQTSKRKPVTRKPRQKKS